MSDCCPYFIGKQKHKKSISAKQDNHFERLYSQFEIVKKSKTKQTKFPITAKQNKIHKTYERSNFYFSPKSSFSSIKKNEREGEAKTVKKLWQNDFDKVQI